MTTLLIVVLCALVVLASFRTRPSPVPGTSTWWRAQGGGR